MTGERCATYTVTGTLDGETLAYEGRTCMDERVANCKGSAGEAGLVELDSDT